MTVAQTILTQIKALDPMAMFAWGTKELINMGDGIKFKTSGMVKKKCYVYVKYDKAQDLYDVIFARIRKHQWIEDHKITGVYFDQLVETIDRYVE